MLKAATDAAHWMPRVAASQVSSGKLATGRGIGLGTHHLAMNQGDRITYAAAVVAAIGNAFFDATGVRLRQFPLTPPRVLAALRAGPVARA